LLLYLLPLLLVFLLQLLSLLLLFLLELLVFLLLALAFSLLLSPLHLLLVLLLEVLALLILLLLYSLLCLLLFLLQLRLTGVLRRPIWTVWASIVGAVFVRIRWRLCLIRLCRERPVIAEARLRLRCLLNRLVGHRLSAGGWSVRLCRGRSAVFV
jgi:hypothetical protein